MDTTSGTNTSGTNTSGTNTKPAVGSEVRFEQVGSGGVRGQGSKDPSDPYPRTPVSVTPGFSSLTPTYPQGTPDHTPTGDEQGEHDPESDRPLAPAFDDGSWDLGWWASSSGPSSHAPTLAPEPAHRPAAVPFGEVWIAYSTTAAAVPSRDPRDESAIDLAIRAGISAHSARVMTPFGRRVPS